MNLNVLALGCPWDKPLLVLTRWNPLYERLVNWVRQMGSLKDLELSHFPSQSRFVQDVLRGSEIKLKLLSLSFHTQYRDSTGPQEQASLYDEISKQTALRSLEIFSKDNGNFPEAFDKAHPLYLALSNALTQLPELRNLEFSMPIFHSTFAKVAQACPHLESLALCPHQADDDDDPSDKVEWLETFKRLRSLKKLRWITESSFTAASLIDFFQDLADDPHGFHRGFKMRLQNQTWPTRYTKKQKTRLRLMAERLGGEFALGW